LRIKEQEICLTLQKHDDDDEDKKRLRAALYIFPDYQVRIRTRRNL